MLYELCLVALELKLVRAYSLKELLSRVCCFGKGAWYQTVPTAGHEFFFGGGGGGAHLLPSQLDERSNSTQSR